MQAIRQTMTVPPDRELRIKLPEEAAAHEEAEVIVLFKSSALQLEDKLASMRAAISDEIFIADLNETMAAFSHADHDEKAA